jgi:hypothetical protein
MVHGQLSLNCWKVHNNFFELPYRPSEPWQLFGFLICSHSVGLLGRVISSSQGLYLNSGHHKQNKHIYTPNIHSLSGIRNHDHSVSPSKDSSCLRPLGYRDRLIIIGKVIPVHAVEAPRVARDRSSHICRHSANKCRQGRQPYAPAAFYPPEKSWYSFLLEAESTPGPQCGWKD